jgi:uroporphyrinogen decarboxylase
MKMKKWIEYQLKNKQLSMPILTFPCTQLIGCTVDQLVHDSRLQAQGMVAIAKKYPMSAALTMMDLSVEAEAFGAEVRFSPIEVPTVVGLLLPDIEAAKKLLVPVIGEKRTKIYLATVEKVKMEITDRLIFAGVTGPFTMAGRLMDMTEIMINCYIDPEFVHVTLEKTTEFLINYILEFKKRGAGGIVMAEPAAGLLSPELCLEFSSTYIKRIKDAVDDENFIFIYHNCGNVKPLLNSIFSIGADAYHFGNATNMIDVLAVAPNDAIIMGNIHPVHEFNYGTPASIKKATLDLLEKCGKFHQFVISSGCDIPAQSKLENIDAYFMAINQYYRL